MLAVLYPHDQLRIMDYNRAVRDLNGLSEAMFLERVGEVRGVERVEHGGRRRLLGHGGLRHGARGHGTI
jgi:uncharacterized protein (DUF1015 family)